MSRIAAAILIVAASVFAQDPPRTPIEVRLIEILHENKVISDAQRDELRALADTMRREDEAAAKSDADLAAQIEKISDRLERADAFADHKAGRGFRFRSAGGDFELRIGGRIQFRFTYDFWSRNQDTDDEDEPGFEVEQARVWLEGHAFEEWLRYSVLFDVAGDTAETQVNFLNIIDDFESSNRLTELKDAYLEIARWKAFRVRAGQFKVPYSRHQLTGAGEQQFVDRSIVNRIFGRGRDIGVMVHGGVLGEDDDVLEYAAGVFNGEGENRLNDDKGLLWAARAMVSPFGAVPYREGDIGRSGRFKASLGVNALLHQDDGHTGRGDEWSAGADLAARYAGWFLLGELHYAESDGTPDDPRAVGWMIQTGYTLIEDTLDIALRAAEVDWDDNGDRDTARREYLVVLGWFFHGHDLKIQSDFGRVEDHQGDHEDNEDAWRLRMQVQLTF